MYEGDNRDKVTDKFYRATATLDNGNDITLLWNLPVTGTSTSVFQMFSEQLTVATYW